MSRQAMQQASELGGAPIDPEAFVARMEERWTRNLGNMASELLGLSWAQQCEAFNSTVLSHDDPLASTKWIVVPSPTGSGKTQGIILYCVMLTETHGPHHPGVLIFTRLKADADFIADEINRMAGRLVAASYHSDADVDPATLKAYPVLVATHSRYRQMMAPDRVGHGMWHQIGSWSGGQRRLVVIDEAPDIISEATVGVDELRQTLVAVRDLQEDFPKEVEYVEVVIDMLDADDLRDSEAVLFDRPVMLVRGVPDVLIEGPQRLDISARRPPALRSFVQAFKQIRFDKQNGITDPVERERLRMLHVSRIESLEMIGQTFMLKARVDGQRSLIASKLLHSKCIRSAVIMDATASANPVYELLDGCTVLPRIEGVRRYTNANLRVSKGHRVGKHFMRGHASELCEGLVADLNVKLAGRNVLVVTHIELEAPLRSYETTFDMHTTHWGQVTGSNQWRDCDAVVIFGLPYPPPIRCATTFMALKGPQDTEWLKKQEKRAFGRHKDIRRAIQVGSMVVDVVQAINRVRCRSVIDEFGNCPPTDIFIWLPDGNLAEDLLRGIALEMPGIRIEEFVSSGNRQKPKRSRLELGLITYIQNMAPGRQRKLDVQRAIGASATTMSRLVQGIKDPESPIAKAMAEADVRYETPRKGRSKVAYFVKA